MGDWSIEGRTALVTGANSGIGYATALELARRGAHLVLLCRDERKGRDAVSGIAHHTSDSPELLVADLSDPLSIRAAVHRFFDSHHRLHVLVNNAGAIFPERLENDAGREMTLQVNHLGPFLLTHLLREILVTSAPARIINVSSFNHRFGVVDFDDLDRRSRPWSSLGAYNDTKLMNILFTRELARQLEGTGVTANAMHPGTVFTNFGRGTWIQPLLPLARWFIRTPAQGADTIVHLATDPWLQAKTGRYWVNRVDREPAARAQDAEVQRKLWKVSRELTGVATDTIGID